MSAAARSHSPSRRGTVVTSRVPASRNGAAAKLSVEATIRRSYQRREPRDEVQRFQHDVRRPVSIRSLQSVPDLPLPGQREALLRRRRPAHVASQAFELRALLSFNPNTRVQRKPRVLRDPFTFLRSRRHRLQRKHLLPRPRAHRHRSVTAFIMRV
jgi:hypothetical protein